jgi:hypothetical protein
VAFEKGAQVKGTFNSGGVRLRVSFSQPILPKEHGAWAVLFVPMTVGASIAGTFTTDVLLLALSAFGLFMSYVPVHIILRHFFVTPQSEEKLRQAWFWSTVYISIGVAFMIPLLMKGLWSLVGIGALGLISFFGNFFLTRRYPKTILSDLLAVFGLSLSGPCAYYVVAGILDKNAFVLWLLNFLFFGCSVFYVHMKIRAVSLNKPEFAVDDKLAFGRLNILYHVAVIALVVVLALYEHTKLFTALAFIPMAAHAVYGTYKLSSRVKFKNLGLLLLGQSVLFGVLSWMVLQ